MLEGKKILIGITGSIAAYKAALLVRLLRKEGCEVQVIASPGGLNFITPLTLSTLSGRPVLSEYANPSTGEWHNHIEWGLWGDAFIIAPATANEMAKAAHGQVDNLLLATYLSARCPVFWAPAMDLDMWAHPATQKNVDLLSSFGNKFIEPNDGELASGLVGKGRMAEPEEIVEYLKWHLSTDLFNLKGKKVLVTTGPTQEPLDPVRYITNHSTGKMGFSIANAAAGLGAEVILVKGPVEPVNPLLQSIEVVSVETASQMADACHQFFEKVDYAVLAAAVADFTLDKIQEHKIKKAAGQSSLHLELQTTLDIAASLGKQKKTNQILVGFALETRDEILNGQAKLEKKNLDFVAVNVAGRPGEGFGTDTNRITLLSNRGQSWDLGFQSKDKLALALWQKVLIGR